MAASFSPDLPRGRPDHVHTRTGPAPTPGRAVEDGRPGRKVLLVEDQADVRRLVRIVLERAGFVVVEAGNAREAQQAVRSIGLDTFDALVTDIVMPGPSGPTLAAELRGLRPGLPVLYLSGYAEEMVRDERSLGEGEAFIAKPFTPEALVRSVRALLPGPDSGARDGGA